MNYATSGIKALSLAQWEKLFLLLIFLMGGRIGRIQVNLWKFLWKIKESNPRNELLSKKYSIKKKSSKMESTKWSYQQLKINISFRVFISVNFIWEFRSISEFFVKNLKNLIQWLSSSKKTTQLIKKNSHEIESGKWSYQQLKLVFFRVSFGDNHKFCRLHIFLLSSHISIKIFSKDPNKWLIFIIWVTTVNMRNACFYVFK